MPNDNYRIGDLVILTNDVLIDVLGDVVKIVLTRRVIKEDCSLFPSSVLAALFPEDIGVTLYIVSDLEGRIGTREVLVTDFKPILPDVDVNTYRIIRNAMVCRLCGSLADRYGNNRFQCQSNPNHIADTVVGIFTDMSYLPTPLTQSED